ncbi:MAG TPA: translation initiation factor IF-2 [Ignavibacteria bacterium]|nr:translation initiation factor IF-2 [Ignavibacteria bacterium]
MVSTTTPPAKKQKLISLVKEINRSKEDIIKYLETIGVEGVSINTSLEPEVVGKVYSHFKKDIEEQDKHLKKVVDFVQKNDINIHEAEEKLKQEEEAKTKREEEERVRKALEEESKRQEEERRKQELIAYQERERLKREQEEKETAAKQGKDKSEPKKVDSLKTDPVRPKREEFKRDDRKRDDRKEPKKDEVKRDDKKEAPRDNRPDFKKNKGKFERVTIKDLKPPKKKSPHGKPDGNAPGRGPATGDKPGVVKPGGKKVDKDKKFKPEDALEKKKKQRFAKGHRAKDISQREIDDAIRETFAKIEEEGNLSARSIARKRKRKEREETEKKNLEYAESQRNVIKVTEYLSTAELANLMDMEANELIKKCFDLGMMVSINQRLEKDLIVLLAEEFGYTIEFQSEYEEDVLEDDTDAPETMTDRPPVVTVMGHVDHGKTSLLDQIRKTNVVAGEAGGITQHIGAYTVELDSGKNITFLDTPGHEAFTAMRARGGQAADIVILVVAADDSVMPQTVEAINHALAAKVPIIVAINKVDKPESNPDRIKQQLSDKGILVEEWGGKYQSVEISAKFGKNLDGLLEKVLVEAELLELKANPDRHARGVVIEAKMDKGKGTVATVLVQKGTLKVGDSFIAGIYPGRVKAMFDEREHKLDAAGPSHAVQILGFDGVPQAGDTFVVLDSERDIKEIAIKRQQLKREQDFRQVKFVTLDDISRQIQEGKQVELNIILKADTDGSAEALSDSLHKLTTSETKVNVIHKAIGQITESDILLAEASNAVIIGFSVRPNLNARKLAERHKVDVRLYNIIYNVLEEVKQALEGMLAPDITEKVTATIEVRDIFKVPKIGNIAGCYVQDGKITRNTKVRLLRDGFVIYDGGISSLKRLKDDVREVDSGYECGIGLENFNDIKIGDIIEGYELVETKRKLSPSE